MELGPGAPAEYLVLCLPVLGSGDGFPGRVECSGDFVRPQGLTLVNAISSRAFVHLSLQGATAPAIPVLDGDPSRHDARTPFGQSFQAVFRGESGSGCGVDPVAKRAKVFKLLKKRRVFRLSEQAIIAGVVDAEDPFPAGRGLEWQL